MPSTDTDDARTRLAGLIDGHLLVTMLGLGHRLGLLEALADGEPRTTAEVAAATGTTPRYVEEWLGALATGGILQADPGTGTFRLPAAHAELLTGATAANLGPVADMAVRLTGHAPVVAERFGDGAGIPAAHYAAAAGDELGASRRRLYEDTFVDGFLGAVPGLADRLDAGADVLDVGCGSGQVARLVVEAHPRCRVTGIDVAPAAVTRARAEHGDLDRVEFREADAADLDVTDAYDVVIAADAVHDLTRPEATLAALRRALRPDGVFVMVDVALPGDLDTVLADPETTRVAANAYAVSVLHCLPTSLHDGGAGWGAMWGRERMVDALHAAGFAEVDVFASPRPQNAVYAARGG